MKILISTLSIFFLLFILGAICFWMEMPKIIARNVDVIFAEAVAKQRTEVLPASEIQTDASSTEGMDSGPLGRMVVAGQYGDQFGSFNALLGALALVVSFFGFIGVIAQLMAQDKHRRDDMIKEKGEQRRRGGARCRHMRMNRRIGKSR